MKARNPIKHQIEHDQMGVTDKLRKALAYHGGGGGGTTVIADTKGHFRFSIYDPASAFAITPRICLSPKIDTAITITNLEVTCNSAPTPEVTGDLKYADAFIGLANPIVINDFDTINGVRSDATFTNATIPISKAVYIEFDLAPDATLDLISFDISYTEV